MHRKVCATYHILQLGFGLLSGALYAEETSPRTLRFVADIFPYLVEDRGHKKICGIGPYLAKAVTESIGHRFEVEILPLPRALKAVEARAKDGIIAIYATEERRAYIRYTSQPLYTDTIRVFTTTSSGINWNGSMDSLKAGRIGVMQGWYYTDRFKKLERDDSAFRLEWIPLRESGFKMLKAKRIDALISNDRNYHNFQSKLKQAESSSEGAKDTIRPLNPPLESKDVFIGFAQHVPTDVVQTFDKKLEQLLKEPRFQTKLPDPQSLCPSP